MGTLTVGRPQELELVALVAVAAPTVRGKHLPAALGLREELRRLGALAAQAAAAPAGGGGRREGDRVEAVLRSRLHKAAAASSCLVQPDNLEEVMEAALLAAAVEPEEGAGADVCPFVALQGACVQLAVGLLVDGDSGGVGNGRSGSGGCGGGAAAGRAATRFACRFRVWPVLFRAMRWWRRRLATSLRDGGETLEELLSLLRDLKDVQDEDGLGRLPLPHRSVCAAPPTIAPEEEQEESAVGRTPAQRRRLESDEAAAATAAAGPDSSSGSGGGGGGRSGGMQRKDASDGGSLGAHGGRGCGWARWAAVWLPVGRAAEEREAAYRAGGAAGVGLGPGHPGRGTAIRTAAGVLQARDNGAGATAATAAVARYSNSYGSRRTASSRQWRWRNGCNCRRRSGRRATRTLKPCGRRPQPRTSVAAMRGEGRCRPSRSSPAFRRRPPPPPVPVPPPPGAAVVVSEAAAARPAARRRRHSLRSSLLRCGTANGSVASAMSGIRASKSRFWRRGAPVPPTAEVSSSSRCSNSSSDKQQ
ncbi:hypothetical protein PLESTM_002076800 [Pleodorina starrii]|nr:hypothetical protein PLESTM_002076800 [Pleodorina starrii]